jgi:N-acetylmuramoyl-L-alanine amidase
MYLAAMVFARRPGALALLLGLVACARSGTTPAATPAADTSVAAAAVDSTRPPTALPDVPVVRGPLAIRVIYPSPDAIVQARDTSFLLGSVGTGDARLTINGYPVRVWPNGGWLAWIPLPPDSLMEFHISAHTAADSAVLDYAVRRGGWRPPPGPELWLDSMSLAPRGRVWWPAGEYLTLSVRAGEGSEVRLRFPDGTVVPLRPESSLEAVPEAVRAFDLDTANLSTPVRRDRYVGVLRGRSVGPTAGPVLPGPWLPEVLPGVPPDSLWAAVEAIRDGDTVRARWPLQVMLLDSLPVVAELHDSAGTAARDRITVGRAVPGGTYHWFFPSGTRARVSGRVNDDLRVRLAPETEAWVAAAEARPVPGVTAVPAVVGSVRLTPMVDRVRIRVPLTYRVPFRVTESERSLTLRLYGALGDVNWIQYGAAQDALIRRVTWAQDGREEVTLTVDLARDLWGYHARWERGDLILDVRRPPDLKDGGALEGRLIAVDPGHPPGGATGPTGLREAEANLGIGLEVMRLLEREGAKVFMTRTTDVPLELWPRVDVAERAGADLLVSIHNNALPDGVNPHTNNGASVYYNQPRSVPLARAIQTALVRRLGVRDLGIGRGDLAMVRSTWMPSVLTEGLFMIVPEQEAALRAPQGRRLYAEAVVEGIRRFMRERALEP